MIKLSTVFKKDPNDLGRVVNSINPENVWAITGEGIPTRKFDGTSCAIIEGRLYKRYDAKKGKEAPEGAIPCQEADINSGHHPHWILCSRNDNASKYHFEAFDLLENKEDGTYELCGEKIQGNPEKIEGHKLIKHGSEILYFMDFSFEGLKKYLHETDIEGIVFHHKEDGRMCKIRKSDFGIKR